MNLKKKTHIWLVLLLHGQKAISDQTHIIKSNICISHCLISNVLFLLFYYYYFYFYFFPFVSFNSCISLLRPGLEDQRLKKEMQLGEGILDNGEKLA